MTQSMIERAARAISRVQWESLEDAVEPDDAWESCIQEARAVIEAMREPTAAMMIAMSKSRGEKASFQAAIDAALAEGER